MGDSEPSTRRAHREARGSEAPATAPAGASDGGAAAATAPRRRVSIVGVFGEILITIGVVALLYVAWQMWIGDWIIGAEKHKEASALSQSWMTPAPSPSASDSPDATPSPTPTASAEAVVPVQDQHDHGTQFGVMFVPRFGPQWQFTIASGTSRTDILDQGEIGHYTDTAMPGGVGNTVYAAHRWTSGAPFDPIDKLVIGDAIVIQTQDGWYTYRFRTLEYVQDTQVEVLLPVPQQVGVAANGRYLTLTSCAPKLNMLERIIAYAVFESFTPAASAPPASLAAPTQGASS